MATTRRKFIGGCSAAIAAMAGSSRISKLTFGDPGSLNGNVLVNIFLRGGWDSMNILIPAGGADRGEYEAARPSLQIALPGGAGAGDPALALTGSASRTIAPGIPTVNNGGGLFVHPRLMNTFDVNRPGELWDIWTQGNLAFVPAAGLSQVLTRSHFDAQEIIELGTGTTSGSDGWLARHLSTNGSNLDPEALIHGAAIGSQEPTSLLGAPGTAGFGDINTFNLQEGYSTWRPAMRTALRNVIEGGGTLNHLSGLDSLDAVDIIESATGEDYTPEPGVTYTGSLADSLESVAQMVKLDLGLQVATIDYGGWDTHNGQGDNSGGGFGSTLEWVRTALANFYLDLNGSGSDPYIDKVTVVVQSEFGRRLIENNDRGTDHGYGNMMMVMGGKVNGGVYGSWPGLQPGDLVDNNDLQVTTDYRKVMTEILVRRLCNPNIETVFPNYPAEYQSTGGPLGIVEGNDLPITPVIFQDGFESGSTNAWG